MKRFFLLLFSFSCLGSFAQTKFGIVAGYQLSDIGSYDLIETSSTGNFIIGVLTEHRFRRLPLYLSGQVVYAPAGYSKSNIQAEDKSGNPLGDIDLHRIGYIKVPVYLLYGGRAGSVVLKGGLGSFIAFQTGDKLKIKGGDAFGNGTVLPSYMKKITPVLYGIHFQAGVEWSPVMISLHFSQSFNGLYLPVSAAAQKWKATAYGITVGFFFIKRQ
ncbi:MAG: hypothetical protein JNK14_17240 [Chitinophagaceae bacterium]|nr:hypothetical protein [Chitinophagaceae bacterium]